MPYFETSYDTTVGRIAVVKQLDKALKESLVSSELGNRRLGVDKVGESAAIFVIGGSTDEMNIPPFIHPYLIRAFKGQNYLVSDVRLFRTVSDSYLSEKDFENGVRNKTEYGLVKSRAVLNLLWLDPSQVQRVRARLNFAAPVFATWLSQAIGRAYALDFQEQARITAVGMYYYHSLFSNGNRLEEGDIETAVIHTIKATKFPATEVYALFENIGEINGIEDYCREVEKAVQNVRLKDFNLAMLLTLIRNTWYGTNAKEILSVALEHPPTWISVVFATLTERTYKSSGLFKIVEMLGKRGAADEFKMNYLEIMRSRTMALESVEEKLVFKNFED